MKNAIITAAVIDKKLLDLFFMVFVLWMFVLSVTKDLYSQDVIFLADQAQDSG